MPQSEIITLAHWEGKKKKNDNKKRAAGQISRRAKSAARPPGNVPVLPMASPRLLVTFGKFFETTEFGTRGFQSSTLFVTDTISLIENLKLNLVKFRDNSEGDFEKVMKLSEQLMIKHDISGVGCLIIA